MRRKTIYFAIVFSSVLAVRSVNGQQQQAEAFVTASWTDAQSVARLLVARDIQLALNDISEALKPLTDAGRLAGLKEARDAVQDALHLAASMKETDLQTSEAQLDKAMAIYRNATAERYRLSWYSVEPLSTAGALPSILDQAHEALQTRCTQGASLPAEDFLTAPRPALPGYRIGFGSRFYLMGGPSEPNRSNVPEFQITGPGGGADKNGREFWYGVGYAAGAGICIATGVAAAAAQYCAAAGAFLVSIYYALADLFDHNHEVEAFAEAEAYRLNKRAVAKDVSALYRQYCGYAVESLALIASVTKMTPTEQASFVAETENATFTAVTKKIVDRQNREENARCHVSLTEAFAKTLCPAIGTPISQPEYGQEPSCHSKDERGVAFQCPLVITKSDSLCRLRPDGTLIRIPVEPTSSGVLIVKEGKPQDAVSPVCTVSRSQSGTYNTSQDSEFLKTLAKDREDLKAVSDETRHLAQYFAVGVIKTIWSTQRLSEALTFGEREMDRQQAFALRNIQRLIRVVRLRRTTVQLTKNVPTRDRQILMPAAQSVLTLTQAMVEGVTNPSRSREISGLLELAHTVSDEAAVRAPTSISVDRLRLIVGQLDMIAK